MYEKTIKFKLEKKFFNQSGFLDNKYVYDWMNLAKKYYLNGLGIDIDSIRSNIRYNSQDIFIKTWIEKHSGIKTIFSYEFYVDGEVVILATSSHNILGTDSDRAIRIDRNLPKWDQILKDVVGNEYKE